MRSAVTRRIATDLAGRLSGGVLGVVLMAALICLCCAGCWRMRRYLDSRTRQQPQSSLPVVGAPIYEYEQQTQ